MNKTQNKIFFMQINSYELNLIMIVLEIMKLSKTIIILAFINQL